ncbi:MAG TPA: Gfo/Idh/MocA family oxidoreductase [Armatimonadota bacterium]|jgi:predicted dehydrogenase
MKAPLRVGVIGMGGFAALHHDAVWQLEQEGACRLVCTCDPALASFAARQQALQFDGRGVRLFADYQEMLAACGDDLDVVTIPTPVPLHAAMHQAVVERGLAAYLEKPPTLDIAELTRMLAVEDGAKFQTNVGFNYIIEPDRHALKLRLMAGEFGAVQRVSVLGLWPRNDRYYARAAWPGRLMLDGRLVLDSCFGNAMAHFVHNGLFWCGLADEWAWSDVREVTAELYRANAIEGTDTAFIRAVGSNGPELLIGMSHACNGRHYNYERIECEQAVITYGDHGERWGVTVHWRDGRKEQWEAGRATTSENLLGYFAYVRGEEPRPVTRLVDSRPFVVINDLAYIAATQITAIAAPWVAQEVAEDGSVQTFVADMAAVTERFVATGEFPSVQGIPWAVPGGSARQDDLPQLNAVISRLVRERAM